MWRRLDFTLSATPATSAMARHAVRALLATPSLTAAVAASTWRSGVTRRGCWCLSGGPLVGWLRRQNRGARCSCISGCMHLRRHRLDAEGAAQAAGLMRLLMLGSAACSHWSMHALASIGRGPVICRGRVHGGGLLCYGGAVGARGKRKRKRSRLHCSDACRDLYASAPT